MESFIPLIVLLLLIAFVLFLVFISALNEKPSKDKKDYDRTISDTYKIPYSPKSIEEIRGLQGESEARKDLRRLTGNNEMLFCNLIVPIGNTFTEIDNILVSKKGIFVIEVKNWVGTVEGDSDSENWVQKYDDDDIENREHYNPIKQNKVHCDAISNLFKKHFDVENVVLFYGCDYLIVEAPEVFETRDFFRKYNSLNEERLSLNEIKTIKYVLKMYEATVEEKEAFRNKDYNLLQKKKYEVQREIKKYIDVNFEQIMNDMPSLDKIEKLELILMYNETKRVDRES